MHYLLILAVAALQWADWATTRAAIARGGHEANPLIAHLISTLGFDRAFVVKGVAVVSLGIWTEWMMPWSAGVIALIYCWIAWHNTRVMR